MDPHEMREAVAEAARKVEVANQAKEKAIDQLRRFKDFFGVKERFGGTVTIDYGKFLESIGPKGVVELQEAIAGNGGDKPLHKKRVKVTADAQVSA